MKFHLFQMIDELIVEIILIIRQGTLSWSIDWCHSKLRVFMDCSWDNSLGNWCHTLQAFIDMLWHQTTNSSLSLTFAELYPSTQFLSSDHSSSVGSFVMRRCSWMPKMSIPTSEQPMNNWWVCPCWWKVLYIICGFNKGFEGRQTTRFRTNSLWCLSEFPLAGHGVIRWRLPICLRSFIWFLPYSSRNRICSRFVFSVQEAMFDGWLALNCIRSFEQVDQRWKSWSLVTCSAPPYWRLGCNPLTAFDGDDVAMGVGPLHGWIRERRRSAFVPNATHTNSYGDTPEPPTTNHIVSMSTQVSVVGVRDTDHPKAQVL